MRYLQLRSLLMRSDSEVDLVLGCPGHEGSVVYRFGIDRRGPVSVLRCPHEYVRDYLQVPGPLLPTWPADLARAALSARSQPLPTGKTLQWHDYETMQVTTDRWNRKQRAAGREPEPPEILDPPPGDRPAVPELLTLSAVHVLSGNLDKFRSDIEVELVMEDSAGGTVRWAFTKHLVNVAGDIETIDGPDEYNKQYLSGLTPIPPWPLALVSLASRCSGLPIGDPLASEHDNFRGWLRDR